MTSVTEAEVLGVRLRRRSRPEALESIRDFLRQGGPHSVYFVHAATANLAYEDPAFCAVLQRGDLVLNDGVGVRLAARLLGLTLDENLVGTDLVPLLLAGPWERPLRVYLLGGRPGLAWLAAGYLREQYPEVRVVGTDHGYFEAAEEGRVVDRVRAAAPDLLLVGMGNPRQERFIDRNLTRLGCSVAMGVGGLFHHWSGGLRRASPWLRRWGLEWAQLLMQQPHKWRRYLIGNVKFLLRALRPAMRSLLSGVVALGCGAVLALAAAEGTVRLVRPQILARYPEGLYVESASRQYRMRPGFRGVFRYPEFVTAVRINGQGLRADRDYGPPAPGTRRILAVGDSFTMGYSVAAERTWVRELERRLGNPWEVINAGVPGYSTWQEVTYLEEEGLALRPEIVLLGFFVGNDIADNANPRLAFRLRNGELVSAKFRGRLDLARRSHLVHLLWRLGHREPQPDIRLEAGWRATAGLLDRVARLCRAAGARLIVVIMPDQSDHGWNRRMTALCERAAVEAVDLAPWLRADGMYFPQDGHWTEGGNRQAAAGIHEYLVRP
jgi:N-acetylglucosaminyldiphosphoundecaprenol N-acetyl-beta-D-mannosaminyltransferase